MAPPFIPIKTRMAKYTDKSGGEDAYHLWTGAAHWRGYGTIRRAGRDGGMAPAHRIAYELVHGPVPKDLYVCHRCDNPRCVNPRHLFVGTPRDNMQDKVAKGRCGIPQGSKHYRTHLTNEMVQAIRSAKAAGETQYAIAKRFGLSQSGVCRICTRDTWRCVP